MLTTIQESVTVDRNGLIQLHVPDFEYNSRLSVVAVVEAEMQNIDKKKIDDKYQFSDFAGMWENRDITIKKIRKEAWK